MPALLGLLLAGCAEPEGYGPGPLTSQGPRPAASPPTATPHLPPSRTVGTTRVAPRPTTTAAAVASTGKPAPVCRAADLSAQPGGHRRSTDDRYDWVTDIQLLNRGSRACTLSGYVGLTMLGQNAIVACNPPGVEGPSPCGGVVDKTSRPAQSINRLPGAVTTYLVKPGEAVSFSMLWVSVGMLLGGDRCTGVKGMQPYQLEIRVPGDSRPIVQLEPVLNPCDWAVDITPLGVTA